MLLGWLHENNYQPKMEIFSGETLMQDIGYEILEMVVYFCSSYKGIIIIPTNMNFVMNDKLLDKFLSIKSKANELGVGIHLSASIDGIYCDSNRPFRNDKLQRDYNKIFSFAKEHNISFHPMVYSEEIEHWQDNFLWFQEMFKKYDIPWDALYLLEVRNSEWTLDQIKEFDKFLRFVILWIRKQLGHLNDNDFFQFALKNKLFNLFSMFYTVGRGTGCSIQSTMQVRTADLTVFPCHRLTYDYFKMYTFITENDKIVGVEGINPELTIAHQVMNHKIFPYCQGCLLKNLCGGQCLGSMYENTGDMFTPIPTVCLLEHTKIKSIINTLYEIGVFPDNLHLVSEEKRFVIPMIHKISEEKVQ
jgi:radical SAM protein with 4Fe4S-binding SPASM domain